MPCNNFSIGFCGLAVFLACIGAHPSGSAQETAPVIQSSANGDRVVYSADYLSQFNAISASDLLSRIPGIQGMLKDRGGDQRGFGSAGDQVLINGQRISGKSNDVEAVLDRIQARQILQIEVIRGSVPGIDTRNQGRVVNVVLADSVISGYGVITTRASYFSSGDIGNAVEMNYNGSRDEFNYLLALEAKNDHANSQIMNRVFVPLGGRSQLESESIRGRSQEYVFSGNTSYTFATGNQLNLNALFEREDESGRGHSAQFDTTDTMWLYDGGRFSLQQESIRLWEIGGDYRHQFAGDRSWTMLLIHSDDLRVQRGHFFNIEGHQADTPELIEVQNEEGSRAETIVRSTYQWPLNERHEINSGLEMASNLAIEGSELFGERDGGLQEIALENSLSRIEERRYEIFFGHTWRMAERLTMDNSLDLERSTLHQHGQEAAIRRQFFYARPRLSLSYELSAQAQLRAGLERTVSQLDFADFVASFNNEDNRFRLINAGNPGLEPETAWEYEVTYEYQLQNDLGYVEASALYADISDHIDLIPQQIQTSQGTLTRVAPGNINDARKIELNFSGSLRLDAFRAQGGAINANILLRNSRARDAFTGVGRSMSGQPDYEWNLGYRQDISRWSVSLETGKKSRVRDYELDYLSSTEQGLDFEILVEWQIAKNLLLQVEADGVLRAESRRDRLVFTDTRTKGEIDQHERRSRRPDREISLGLSWTFQ